MHLFAVTLEPNQVALWVTSLLAVILLVKVASDFFAWKVRERKYLTTLASELDQYGLLGLGDIVQCIANEDFPGAVKEVEYLAKQLKDPATAKALLSSVVLNGVPGVLADPVNGQALLTALGNWATLPANAGAIKAAGLAIALLPK